jgi:hypothetical protein
MTRDDPSARLLYARIELFRTDMRRVLRRERSPRAYKAH